MYLGGKTFSLVLIGVVVILTLALAMLAGFVFLVGGHSTDNTTVSNISNKVKDANVTPTEDQLASEKLTPDNSYFNLKSNDPSKISVLAVDVDITYYIKIDGVKSPATTIAFYNDEMNEYLSTYFSGLTINDVMNPQTKEKAKEDITKRFNEIINSSATSDKDKKTYIYTIVFGKWFYQ